MAAYEYDDFWVEFTPRDGGGYDVAARAPDGTTATGGFELPFSDEQLEQAVRTIGYTRAAATRDIGEVSTERRLTAEQLGGQLADALLAGPTGDLYGNARAAAVALGRGVRLWLSLGKAPGLLSVPWEFLYLQPTFLASQRKTPIVRFLSTDAPVAPRRIERSVRILGVVASPDGLSKLDVEQERKRVDDALVKARQDRDVTIDWLDPATPKALRLALQQGDYHILHFVGHSGYADDSASADGGGGVIYLENEDRTPAPISDGQLVNLLGDQDSLRLVVLNSCEGARTSVRDPFAGIATSIVALGIPAVVAMQFEISDKAAIAFAEELYQSLIAREEPIDVAVAEARKAVFTEVNETEWATPVLFLRNEDGRIFDFAPIVAAGGTGTAADGRPSVTVPARVRPAWLIGIGAVAVVVLLFGGVVATGLIGGPATSPSPASSSEANAPSDLPTDGPTPVPALSADPTSSTPVASPTPSATTVLVPGTAEWAGPREKSNLLAVAAGPSSSVTNLSTVRPDASEARARPAGVATSKANVLDTDPAWDPNRSVLGFTRWSGDGSDIGYVVPGVGQRPDGQVDRGITVKDPIDDRPPSGTHDHAPAWLDDGDLLFARTRQCAPSRDCAEDIVRAELTRIGDYIEVTNERPVVVSADWSEIRNISAEPGGTGRFLVTGRNRSERAETLGVWIVDRDGSRALLPGSDNAAYAIFGAKGAIVALVGGSEAGWGPVLAVWSSIDTRSPRFIDAFFVLGRFAGVGDVPSAAEAEFGWISLSPLDDGRYAVLISNGTAARRGGGPLPVIGLLDPDFAMSEVVEPRPPSGQTWKQIVALGW